MALGPDLVKLRFNLTYAGELVFELKSGRIEATVTGTDMTNGRIVGGIANHEINRIVAKLLDNVYKANTAASGMLGDVLDTNGDGTISTQEVASNSLAQLLLKPDVDLDGDGVKELSFGLGFTATSAQILLTP
jgi:hypothetical protein